MSAINVLTFPKIVCFPRVCCDRVCGRAETHFPVMREPAVSARWTLETKADGTQRLVERWAVNERRRGGAGGVRHCGV